LQSVSDFVRATQTGIAQRFAHSHASATAPRCPSGNNNPNNTLFLAEIPEAKGGHWDSCPVCRAPSVIYKPIPFRLTARICPEVTKA
jgi:hypothetical protein